MGTGDDPKPLKIVPCMSFLEERSEAERSFLLIMWD